MSNDNLPVPSGQPDPQADAMNLLMERRRLAALAESTLRFRRSASDALDALLVEMIAASCEVGYNKFTTPNGRPCIVIVGVGEDPTGFLTDVAYRLTQGVPDRDTDSDTEEDERRPR